jgi:hypothetical protein
MANLGDLKILRQGAEAWNKWRIENRGIAPNLSWGNLSGADLSMVNLSEANLSRAIFLWTNLSEANLNGATLSATNLSRANLHGANFNTANLNGADLRWANLSGANLAGANLRGADLSGATLSAANLTGADLSDAELSRAHLRFTNFTSSNIEGTNFADSRMVRTVFADVDLGRAKGLEKVRHEGPLTIGTDTLERSQGRIPDVFLRGAGVSDELIAFSRAMGGAIQFYSCFISYSSTDQLFAERLHADLQAKGVRCWFAPHDVQGGKKLHEQIDNAIQMHERLLLILSPDSINSEWVKTEIAKARKREVLEKRRMLFPVLLKISYKKLQEWECFDADTGKDSAREIREYYIPDFSQWELPEKFKEEFEKLVRDLKKAEAAK